MTGAGDTASEAGVRRGFRWGRLVLVAFALAALYAAAALLAPYIPASRFEGPLKQALEQTLGRGVELGDVRYSLYPSPGLSAKNLVIHEAPEFGIEPLAYVSEIQVGLRWGALLRGRIECASVSLDEASVNIARTEEGGWNFASFLGQMTHGLRRTAGAPTLKARNSRINFRDGVRKSPFFLNSVDLDLSTPPTQGGEYAWSYEASPARTDRSAEGFGRFSGSGRWRPAGGERGILDLDLELERSVIAEVAMLLTGRDPGVQGRVAARAHLSGPPDDIQVRGTLRLGDLQKPSLFNVSGREWGVPFVGVVDMDRQTIEVGTAAPKDAGGLPVSVRIQANSLLTRPDWQAQLMFDGLPAATLLEIARRLGAQVPPGLSVEGTLAGPLEFAAAHPAKGSIELKNGAVRFSESNPYEVESAKIVIGGTMLSLEDATLAGVGAGRAGVGLEWDVASGAISFESSLERAQWKDLRAALASVPGLPLPAGIEACDQGELDGDLRLERKPAAGERGTVGEGPARETGLDAHWTGSLKLSGVRCALEGSQEPVRIERGQLTIAGPGWRLRRAAGRLGATAWSGEASWQPPAAQPVKFSLAVEALEAKELERVFRPALGLPASLIARTLGLRRAPLPEWLARRKWDGRITAGTFTLAGYPFSRFTAQLLWTGDSIDLVEVEARPGEGRIQGRGSVSLGGIDPHYRLRGVFEGLEWEGHGVADGEFGLSAAGLGDELLRTLRCQGQVNSRSLELSGEKMEQVAAEFDYDASRAGERLRLTGVEGDSEGAAWLGSGGSAGDGRWRAELASGTRVLRVTGTFLPFRLESESGNEPRER